MTQLREIRAAVPSAGVDGDMGRPSAFEVTVDGMLAFSKLATRMFPDFKAVAREVAEYAASGVPPPHWKRA